jgi:hypothetical protein
MVSLFDLEIPDESKMNGGFTGQFMYEYWSSPSVIGMTSGIGRRKPGSKAEMRESELHKISTKIWSAETSENDSFFSIRICTGLGSSQSCGAIVCDVNLGPENAPLQISGIVSRLRKSSCLPLKIIGNKSHKQGEYLLGMARAVSANIAKTDNKGFCSNPKSSNSAYISQATTICW